MGREHRRQLKELMNKKELVGDLFNNLRLTRQRLNHAARANSSTVETATDSNGLSSESSSRSNGEIAYTQVWLCAAAPTALSHSVCGGAD